MAKKEAKVEVEANVENKDTQVVNNVNEAPEAQEVEKEKEKEVLREAPKEANVSAEVAAAGKLVKVHTMEEVNCTIAGVSYSFAKGKDVKVPTDVAAILVNAQKVYRN